MDDDAGGQAEIVLRSCAIWNAEVAKTRPEIIELAEAHGEPVVDVGVHAAAKQ